MTIKPLEPPDSFHLEAAMGWLELGNHLEANEELMPERVNSAKKDRVGVRQVALARMLNQAGLLSAEGVKKVEGAHGGGT